jgi:hypothetical protein
MGVIRVFAISILLPLAAFAGEFKPTNCPSSVFASITIQNYSDFAPLSCEDFQATIENGLKTVQAVSPVDVSTTVLVIYNYELPKGGRYSWMSSTMSLDIADKSKIAEKLPTFYHEMGHKIYFEAMARAKPEIREHRAAIDGYVEYMHDCAVRPETCAADERKQAMLKASDSFSDDFDTFIYVTTPYNELFADVVSALASGDRDALARSLGPCTQSNPACEYRALSKNTSDKFAGENC